MSSLPESAVAYVGLGANLGDADASVRAAMRDLQNVAGVIRAVCSSLYRTAPVGFAGQPDFINAVCRLTTTLTPPELLQALRALERRYGRVRSGIADQPRTLDLDLLLYGQRSIDEAGLVVPHPRLHERAFVLYPLCEIAPDLEIPGQGPATALRDRCRDQRVEKLGPSAPV